MAGELGILIPPALAPPESDDPVDYSELVRLLDDFLRQSLLGKNPVYAPILPKLQQSARAPHDPGLGEGQEKIRTREQKEKAVQKYISENKHKNINIIMIAASTGLSTGTISPLDAWQLYKTMRDAHKRRKSGRARSLSGKDYDDLQAKPDNPDIEEIMDYEQIYFATLLPEDKKKHLDKSNQDRIEIVRLVMKQRKELGAEQDGDELDGDRRGDGNRRRLPRRD